MFGLLQLAPVASSAGEGNSNSEEDANGHNSTAGIKRSGEEEMAADDSVEDAWVRDEASKSFKSLESKRTDAYRKQSWGGEEREDNDIVEEFDRLCEPPPGSLCLEISDVVAADDVASSNPPALS